MNIWRFWESPIDQWDDPDRWTTQLKLAALYTGAIALATAVNLTQPWDSVTARTVRFLGSAIALGFGAIALRENRNYIRMEDMIQARRQARTRAAAKFADRQAEQFFEALLDRMPIAPAQQFTIPAFPTQEFITASTGACIMGDSGSGKTCVIQHLLNHIEGNVLVLDPHADPSHHEYPWGELSPVISAKSDIFEQMRLVLKLIEAKDRTPLTIVCDEWTSVYAEAKRRGKKFKRLAEDFIISMSTEGQKFGKFLILIGHTDNVALYGLKDLGGLLQNFSLLRLGDIATRYVANMRDRETADSVTATAYPLLWGDRQFIHPTHGSYQQRQKQQPPIGLAPLKSRSPNPVTMPQENHSQSQSQHSTDATQWLERCHSLPCVEPSQEPGDTPTAPHCPHCDSTEWKPNGSYNNRKRARCASCQKSFYLE